MTEPEKFFDRWSRRKQEAADEPAPAGAKNAVEAPPPAAEANEAAAELPFDIASLPPVESITAASDVRAFLRPGVPPELTRAALRRAWSADPQIRDFIGLVENGWNFNDPHDVPGFGPMPVGENIAQLLAQAIGLPAPAEPELPQQAGLACGDSKQKLASAIGSEPTKELPQDQSAAKQDLVTSQKDFAQRSEDNGAAQNFSEVGEDLTASRRRGHGGALPK